MSLLACPFCREMFDKRERSKCPVCGVALVPFETLPISDEALSEDGIAREPDTELLPKGYLGRGRGPLVMLSLLGLVAFFLPWIAVTMPDIFSMSGYDLARRLGWSWGAGVAWVVLIPIIGSRRTIRQMRGARVATAFLAAVPGMTAIVLLARPPHGAQGVVVHFSFEPGLFATVALSVATVLVAVFFGGRPDDIEVRRGTSSGQLVH